MSFSIHVLIFAFFCLMAYLIVSTINLVINITVAAITITAISAYIFISNIKYLTFSFVNSIENEVLKKRQFSPTKELTKQIIKVN